MPENCYICKNCATRHTPHMKCNTCCNVGHVKCLKLPEDTPDYSVLPGMVWRCPSCCNKPATATEKSDMSRILEKLNDLQADMSALKGQQLTISTSLEFYSSKFDEFSAKITVFEEKINCVSKMEQNIDSINNEVAQLKAEVNNLQQYTRINNFEVGGVPEATGENVLDIIKKITATLGITDVSPVECCHRVPHVNKSDRNPRSIIVKTTRRDYKDAVISAIRARKGLNAVDIGFINSSNKIYINDHLTGANKMLYKKTREVCKAKNWHYWLRDCKIFVRNPSSGHIMLIDNERVLNKIK